MTKVVLAQEAAKERERRAQADAKARKERLQRIAARAPAVWEEVSAWIAKRTPKGYDQATKLLIDLKDATALANRGEEFDLRGARQKTPDVFRKMPDDPVR